MAISYDIDRCILPAFQLEIQFQYGFLTR